MNDEALLTLAHIPGLEHKHYRYLIDHQITLIELIKNPRNFAPLSLPPRAIKAINGATDLNQLIQQAQQWESQSDTHYIISLNHPLYPKLLKQISDPPLVLFAIGNIQQLTQPKIAIVGTRNCSNYAKEILTHLTPFLVGAKLNIVSGMALGVDTLAHQTTLKLNANTIAVLGTGVDICFPYQNRQLYHQIASNGLLLSEFPLKSSPKRFISLKEIESLADLVLEFL